MSFTLKQKFISAIGLTFISMVFIKIINNYTISQIDSYHKVSLEIARVQSNMLMLRRNEKDFLARNKLKYSEKFNKNFQILEQSVSELKEHAEQIGIDILPIEKMQTAFEQYRKSFNKLVNIQKNIGLHHKDGLYGSLRNTVHAVEERIKQLNDSKLRADMLQLRRNEKDFMLRLDMKYQDKFNKNIDVFLQSLDDSQYAFEVKQEIKDKIKQYQKQVQNLIANSQLKGLDSNSGILGEMRQDVHESEKILATISDELNMLIEQEIGDLNTLIFITNLVGFILTFLVMVILVWLTRNVLKPLDRLAGTMMKAAQNNDLSLRVAVENDDEIGKTAAAFNTMLEHFQKIISEINHSANDINQTSLELSKITHETSSGAQQQQMQTQEVSTAIHEMSQCIHAVAQNASKTAAASSETRTKSEEGAEIIKGAQQTIKTLSEGIEEAATAISKVENDSDQIGSVLAVIQGIAEQTNLLALNAAIEAARAGEQGRGFAVVADEVRTLAGRTQDATQEIQEMIETLQSGSKNAVELMKTSQDYTHEGVEQTMQVGGSIMDIVTAVEQIDSMTGEIATSAEQQSVVAEEIKGNIETINTISTGLSQQANQTASVSSDLSNLAGKLHQLVAKFKI